ncbi:MAG: SDR family oxidoreductase [Sediminibacterium sp.]|jgi:L-fucose dehydrogenase
MNLSLENKVIIVSGGARGIGEGIVKTLLAEKAIPVVIDQRVSSIEGVKTIQADLTNPQACATAIENIAKEFGSIDGLVNNAGVNDGVNLANGNYQSFIDSLHKNLVHYYLLAHHALPYLKTSKGAIVNISSKTAETGQGGTSAYAAANGGRNALTREWAVELLPFGIRVNAVVVAECYTPMYQEWIQTQENPEEKLQSIQANIPLGKRFTTPEEIGQTVSFLLSEKSSHTTGQLIHVDGGYVHLDRAL